MLTLHLARGLQRPVLGRLGVRVGQMKQELTERIARTQAIRDTLRAHLRGNTSLLYTIFFFPSLRVTQLIIPSKISPFNGLLCFYHS